MHPVPVVGDGVFTLILFSSQAPHKALALHIARDLETGVLQPGRCKVHVGDYVLTYRARLDTRPLDQELGD